jgi:hypothetical protein
MQLLHWRGVRHLRRPSNVLTGRLLSCSRSAGVPTRVPNNGVIVPPLGPNAVIALLLAMTIGTIPPNPSNHIEVSMR